MLDIESALQKIDDVTSNQEGTAAEEALILRGCVNVLWTARLIAYSPFCLFQSPQPKRLNEYIDALERLNTSIAFASTAANQRDTVRLESSHSLSSFLILWLTGEAGRNGGQETRAVIHKGCCLWLLRHSSCGL